MGARDVAKTRHNYDKCESPGNRNGQRVEGGAGDGLSQCGTDRGADNGEYQDEGSDQFSRKRANRIVTDHVPMQTRGNPDATLTPGY